MTDSLQFVDYANSLIPWVMNSGENFKELLNIMSVIPQMTLNNQLLLLGYKKDAVLIKDYEEWLRQGVNIRENATYIPVLVPVKESGDFEVKSYVDVNDTDMEYKSPKMDNLDVLEAVLTNRNAEICIVEELKQYNVKAFYEPKEKLIKVQKSSQVSADTFAMEILRENYHSMYHKAYEEDAAYPRGNFTYVAQAAAYATCKRYGIDTEGINLDNIPNRYTRFGDKEARKLLDMVSGFNRQMCQGMDASLETIKSREIGNREVLSYDR